MTAKMRDILAWARKGEEMFGVPCERIMEAVAEWEDADAPTPKDVVRDITRIAAATLRPGIECETLDGRLMMPERRRIVLATAKATGLRSGAKMANELFDLDRLAARERARLVDTIGDDLDHWRKMGALDKEDAGLQIQNGPEQTTFLKQ